MVNVFIPASSRAEADAAAAQYLSRYPSMPYFTRVNVVELDHNRYPNHRFAVVGTRAESCD